MRPLIQEVIYLLYILPYYIVSFTSHYFLAMKFFALAAILPLALALVDASVATIKSDVSTIDSDVTALNKKLSASNIGYLEALGIDSAAQALDKEIKQGTSDVNANTETVTDADSTDIINTLIGTQANVKTATDRLIALKSTFTGLGVSGLAQSDINNLATDTQAFDAAASSL